VNNCNEDLKKKSKGGHESTMCRRNTNKMTWREHVLQGAWLITGSMICVESGDNLPTE